LPDHYFILEVSAHLRGEQGKSLMSQLPDIIKKRIIWLDAIPKSFNGVVIANEVLDALPVHLIQQGASSINEVGVGLEDECFVWKSQQLQSEDLLDFVSKLELSEGYVTEVCSAATGLIATLANALQLGAVMMIDYGFSRNEYYHPQRRQGTLMCHYRHHSHSNPFIILAYKTLLRMLISQE